jgi:hypothetical protein
VCRGRIDPTAGGTYSGQPSKSAPNGAIRRMALGLRVSELASPTPIQPTVSDRPFSVLVFWRLAWPQGQHAARLLLEGAEAEAVTRQIELALLLDGHLDVR